MATSAIRFYEARGLIRSRRTTGNQRRYEQAELRRVAFIRTAQRVGLSLDEIGEALATLPENRVPTKADWTRLSRAWRPRLDEQIQRIERLRDQLDGCIGCGCLSLRNCALRNPQRRDGRTRSRRGLPRTAVACRSWPCGSWRTARIRRS